MGASFLQDNDGNNSSSRLGYLLWVCGTLVAWLFVAFMKQTLPDIPETVLGVLGIFLAQKTVQKHIEVNAAGKSDEATNAVNKQ